ncbi:MAG: glycosyltransferase family 4 protein [Alphaproteobacteria bacterium]|jgi:glycosyltransferase involved in cell wall biosynthesis|nr:glycosyltransferase family 4 protein [Alphaproteobacteria bacterium]
MPRVLMAVGSFPATSETFIVQEAASLVRRGVKLWSVTSRPETKKPLSETEKNLSAQTDYAAQTMGEFLSLKPWRHLTLLMRAFRILKPIYPVPTVLRRLYAFLRLKHAVEQGNIDSVHAHWRGASDCAYVLNVLCGVPYTFFVHAHDLYDEGLGKDAAYRALFAKKIAAAGCVFTCTAFNKDTLNTHFPNANIRLIYHGVAAETLRIGEERQYKNNNSSLSLLSVGRLVAYKGFQDVVPIALKLRAAGVDFCWTLVGSGSLEETIRADIAANGLEKHVVLKGALPHSGVLNAMKESDVFVFLGKPESGQYGLPNVLIEAAATGLALVTTPQPTLAELCTPGESCLAAALEKMADTLITLAQDRSLQENLGKAAHLRAKNTHQHDHHCDALWQECEAVCSR